MHFTHDPAKSKRNIAERGLAFNLAEDFDWSTALIIEDTRQGYLERRYQALGLITGHLHMLVARRCCSCDQPSPCQPA